MHRRGLAVRVAPLAETAGRVAVRDAAAPDGAWWNASPVAFLGRVAGTLPDVDLDAVHVFGPWWHASVAVAGLPAGTEGDRGAVAAGLRPVLRVGHRAEAHPVKQVQVVAGQPVEHEANGIGGIGPVGNVERLSLHILYPCMHPLNAIESIGS